MTAAPDTGPPAAPASADTPAHEAPTLGGWVLRDAVLIGAFALLLWGLHAWNMATGGWLPATMGAIAGFVAAYVVTYAIHEWGHLAGARLSGARMPLAGYRGALIGHFDIAAHSVRQFQALSVGGVIGYLASCTALLTIHSSGILGYAGAGLAVGGLAFIVQSLAVDLPQIVRVARGEDPAAVSQTGATGRIIVRRTWQTWIPLTIVLAALAFA